MKNKLILPLLAAAAVSSQAATLNFTHVRESAGFHSAIVTDTSSGFYFERGHFSSAPITVYNSQAAFEAGTPLGVLNLAGGGPAGPYIAAVNGDMFGRFDTSTSASARWDLTTTAFELSDPSFANMGGINFDDTYNWGGYSGVNFYSDATGLYAVGRDLSGPTEWQINKVDQNLNVLATTTFTGAGNGAGLGFGVMINGWFLAGDEWSQAEFDHLVDASTGNQTPFNVQLNGVGGIYINNMLYDGLTDTLYVHSAGNIYKATDVAETLGLEIQNEQPVPEVQTYAALFGALLAGREILRRRKA